MRYSLTCRVAITRASLTDYWQLNAATRRASSRGEQSVGQSAPRKPQKISKPDC